MACEAHDIRPGEIRKSPGREQSARVLLSARLRSINIKKLANIDGVAQDEHGASSDASLLRFAECL